MVDPKNIDEDAGVVLAMMRLDVALLRHQAVLVNHPDLLAGLTAVRMLLRPDTRPPVGRLIEAAERLLISPIGPSVPAPSEDHDIGRWCLAKLEEAIKDLRDWDPQADLIAKRQQRAAIQRAIDDVKAISKVVSHAVDKFQEQAINHGDDGS